MYEGIANETILFVPQMPSLTSQMLTYPMHITNPGQTGISGLTVSTHKLQVSKKVLKQ